MIVVCGKTVHPCTSDRHDDLVKLAAYCARSSFLKHGRKSRKLPDISSTQIILIRPMAASDKSDSDEGIGLLAD